MALPASALTTLATALDELELESDGGAQDRRVERLIRSASGFIARHCSCTFERADAIVEKVKGSGFKKLVLARTPVLTITSIKIGGTTISLGDVRIANAEAGIIEREAGWTWDPAVADSITAPPLPGQENANVEVTYNGGWVTPQQVELATFAERTLPDELEDACLMLVAMRWRGRGVAANVEQQSGSNASHTKTKEKIPPEVLVLIEPFARIAHG